MLRRLSLSFALLFLIALLPSSAEVTRLPFFPVLPAFVAGGTAFPALSGWVLFDHVLNQRDTPDSAQCLDSGALFTLWSTDRLSFGGLAREMFQFKPSPEGDFFFWSRALVTDLRLEAAWRVDPAILVCGYRHDCKHDIEASIRDAIHDTLFAQCVFPAVGIDLEAEFNLPLIFQSADREPDRGRLSAEYQIVPVSSPGGLLSLYADGRCSLINRGSDTRVSVADEWNLDWLVRAGAAMKLGHGGLRLQYALERVTDDWASLTPSPETVSSVSFSFFSDN
jgi:hypothetical protein